MSGSLALAATVVLGFGSSAFGTIGTVAELTVKEINKERHPILRTVGEVFSKTMQNTAATVALTVLGSLFVGSTPIGLLALGFGAIMILTPPVNGIAEGTSSEALKRAMHIADQITSATAKTINTAVLTVAVYMAAGPIAAIATGAGLSALSYATYQKA